MKKIIILTSILFASIVHSFGQVKTPYSSGDYMAQDFYDCEYVQNGFMSYYGLSLMTLFDVGTRVTRAAPLIEIDLDQLEINEVENGFFIPIQTYTSTSEPYKFYFGRKEIAYQFINDILRVREIGKLYHELPSNQSISEPDLSIPETVDNIISTLDNNGRDLLFNEQLEYYKVNYYYSSCHHYRFKQFENKETSQEEYEIFFDFVDKFRKAGRAYLSKYQKKFAYVSNSVVCFKNVKELFSEVNDIPETWEEYLEQLNASQTKKLETENANAIDESGNSPIINAILANDLDKVKQLIKINVNTLYINEKTNSSVLNYAVKSGNVEIVRAILYSDKMITEQLVYPAKNHGKEIITAIKLDNMEIFNALVVAKSGFEKDENGDWPVQLAYRLGNMEFFKRLVNYNYALENSNTKGETVLMMAVRNNDLESIKRFGLLDSKYPNEMDKEGYTAFMIMSELGYTEMIQYCISKNYTKEWKFVSTEGKMKGKSAIDLASDKEIKKIFKDLYK